MDEVMVVGTHAEKGNWIVERGFPDKDAAEAWIGAWRSIFAHIGVSLEAVEFRLVSTLA